MTIETILERLGLVEPPNRLEAQLDSLRRDLRKLAGHLSREVGHISREAGHRADDWSEQAQEISQKAAQYGALFADRAGRQAMRGAEAVRRDPLPAIAAVGTIFLLARLLRR
jgi:hypothetical protein